MKGRLIIISLLISIGYIYALICPSSNAWTSHDLNVAGPYPANVFGSFVCGGAFHGVCNSTTGLCQCSTGYSGTACEVGVCGASAILQCTGNGYCIHSGTDTDGATCNCNRHEFADGFTTPNTAVRLIFAQYSGNSCEINVCQSSFPSDYVNRTNNDCCSIAPARFNGAISYQLGCGGHQSGCTGGGNPQCICNAPYFGPGCEWGGPCAYNTTSECSGHGLCQFDPTDSNPLANTQCFCNANYSGVDCSIDSCGTTLPKCSGNGTCINGGCQCFHGFVGSTCNVTGCMIDSDCNGGGTCSNFHCSCFGYRSGLFCENHYCGFDDHCLQRGVCNNASACACNSGYQLSDCSDCVQPLNGCPDCSYPGTTNWLNTGMNSFPFCICGPEYFGNTCQFSYCNVTGQPSGCDVSCAPSQSFCNGNGFYNCTLNQCLCTANFTGPNCTLCSAGQIGQHCDIRTDCSCSGNGTCIVDGTGVAIFTCPSNTWCGSNLAIGGVIYPAAACWVTDSVAHSFACSRTWKCNCNPANSGINCNTTVQCDPFGTAFINNSCECSHGYSGIQCNESLCTTSPNHCNAFGNCIGNGTCNCTVGYFGQHCEFGPCGPVNNTCNGNGVCDGICTCFPSAYGQYCETLTGCSVGGTISFNSTGNSNCFCGPGYDDPNDGCCSIFDAYRGPCTFGGVRTCPPLHVYPSCVPIVVNHCDSNNGAQCTNCIADNAYLTDGVIQEQFCKPGFFYAPGASNCCPYGQFQRNNCGVGGQLQPCNTKTCDYNSVTCNSNGACVTSGAGSQCFCSGGYHGAVCELPPCVAIGTYTNTTYGECDCIGGFTGQFCGCPPPFKSYAHPSNSASLCGGVDTCTSTFGVCGCADGDGGTYCCAGNGCNGNGICSLTNANVSVCQCYGGWTGIACNITTACTLGCSSNGVCSTVPWSSNNLDRVLGYMTRYDLLYANMTTIFYGGPVDNDPISPATVYFGSLDAINNFVKQNTFQIEIKKRPSLDARIQWLTDAITRILPDFVVVAGPYISILASNLTDPLAIDNNARIVGMLMLFGTQFDTSTSPAIALPVTTALPFKQCICNQGFYGKGCISVDLSVISPLNGEICTGNYFGDFHGVYNQLSGLCVCRSRYIGVACETFLGETCFHKPQDTTPCSFHGQCQLNSTSSQYYCACRDGIIGDQCTEFSCSANSLDPNQRTIECHNLGSCPSSGICICNVAASLALSNQLGSPPVLPVGTDCQYNAINECGVAVLLGGSIYSWRECNGHGTCVNDTNSASPYCVCNNGYDGVKCTVSICGTPGCNTHETCNEGNGQCNCNPKWSTPAGTCTNSSIVCRCLQSSCGHGVPSSNGTYCICDQYYRRDSTGSCTIIQCPLNIMTDTGEKTCDASCSTTTAALSHTAGCCYDACVTGSGATRCSLNSTGSPVCACTPTIAFTQINGICFSKCHGQPAIADSSPQGFSCFCDVNFYVNPPFNSTTSWQDSLCNRFICLNGGILASNQVSCRCVSGYTGQFCQISPPIQSSSSSSTAVSTHSSTGSISSSSSSSGSVHSSTHSSSVSGSSTQSSTVSSQSSSSLSTSSAGVISSTLTGSSSSSSTGDQAVTAIAAGDEPISFAAVGGGTTTSYAIGASVAVVAIAGVVYGLAGGASAGSALSSAATLVAGRGNNRRRNNMVDNLP